MLAQVAQVEYGKNRVQYHDDFEDWELYESKNFVIYWYGKSRNQGILAAQLAEQNYPTVFRMIEHRINDKIEIIVYADVSDFRQSNIGQEETFEYIEGQPKVVGNKIFVFFNGDREHLAQQLRGGIAQIFLTNMFFGSNLQELVQNAVSSEMPIWYRQGLIQYIAEGWSPKADAALRNWFFTKKNNRFKKLDKTESILVGHSFWNFIATRYGKGEISNLLYVSRINRNLDDAFVYVFGQSKKDLFRAWQAFYGDMYEKEKSNFASIDLKTVNRQKIHKRSKITSISYSPDGAFVAFVENRQGRSKVKLVDRQTGETSTLYKFGFRNNLQATDYRYPLISWLPDGSGLFIVYEQRDDIQLRLLKMGSKDVLEQILPERYERIYSMSCLSENELVFSGLSLGLIDLYYYTPNTRQSNRLTNDIYDDLDAQVVLLNDKPQILFRSNRPDTSSAVALPDTLDALGPHQIYYRGLEESAAIKASGLRTPTDITDLYYENGTVYYLSEKSGVKQLVRQKFDVDAGLEYLTVDPFNTEKFAIDPAQNELMRSFFWEKHYQLIIEPDRAISYPPILSETVQQQNNVRQTVPNTSVFDANRKVVKPSDELIQKHQDIDNGKQYLFQSRWNDMAAKQIDTTDTQDDVSNAPEKTVTYDPLFANYDNRYNSDFEFDRLKLIPYRTKFRIQSFKTDLDNNPLFGGLNSFAGFRDEYQNPPVGILTKAVFKDVFEDHWFEAGVRIPTSFNGSEYFIVYNNNKKRIDKQYALYRKSEFENTNQNNTNLTDRTTNVILLGQATYKYPLDIFQSVSATATIRQDKFVFNASNLANLDAPNQVDKRLGLRLTYVFDNAIDIDINMRHGTRAKVYVEALKRFQFTLDPWNVSFDDGFMTTVGFDARQYFQFARHMIFGVRAAGATSFGSERILNFLGGVDNGLIDQFNEDTQQPNIDATFAYTTLQPNLRGFDYNVRNGSNFAVLNSELRIPVVKFINPNIRLSLLRHLQFVGFFDVGLAWEGFSPFDDDTPVDQDISNPPTVRVIVNYFRDPVVAGYGVGLRTMLFGYFIRADYAWGIETRQVQSPKLHLAFGVDF